MTKKNKKFRLYPVMKIRGIENSLRDELKPIMKGMINQIIEKLQPFADAEKQEERLRKKAFKEAKESFYEPNIDKILEEGKNKTFIQVMMKTKRVTKIAALFSAANLKQTFDEKYYNTLIEPVIMQRKFKIITTVITKNLEKELKTGITRMLKDGETAQKTINHFKGLKTNYRTIARTETLSAANQAGYMMADKELDTVGIKKAMNKTWNITGRETRDSHIAANGQTVPFNEPFTLGSGAMPMFPMDSNLDAADFINCLCYLTYETAK